MTPRSAKVLTGKLTISKQVVERMQASPEAFTKWADQALAERAGRLVEQQQSALDEMLKSVYTQPLLDEIERATIVNGVWLASDEQPKSAHFAALDGRIEGISPDDLTIIADEESDVLDHTEYERLLALWKMARDGATTAPPIAKEAKRQLELLLVKHALAVSIHAVCRCTSVDALADLLAPSMVAKSTVDDDGGRFGARVTGGPAVDAGIKAAFGTASLRT